VRTVAPRPGIVQPAQNQQQQYNPWQTVNGLLYWVPQGYQLSRHWYSGFEVWAMQYQHIFPNGMVPHYNISDANGTQYHVYVNAYGGYETVPLGGRPTGY